MCALCAGLALCAASQVASGAVYKCAAPDGRMTFSDQPCESLHMAARLPVVTEGRAAPLPAAYAAPAHSTEPPPQRPPRKD
ncbi:MAG: DUF4124 domain-containing protein [Rhodocyclaceae bacterium]|nr:DUF4124 domain-containing protein [Rhodocyclaceae bacterium]